jgi:hypothetical protein
MARKTLLEIVQQLLAESDGDNVNSINDTVESDQCARIVREAHDYIVDVHDMQHIKTLKQLDATSGTTPNVMTRPEGYHSLEWVKYDKKESASGNSELQDVHFENPYDFVTRVSRRDTDDSNVTAVTLSTGAVLPIINDKAPTYYTVMDDGSDELVFDSYDSDLETNLQASKSLCFAAKEPTLPLADASTMVLPQNMESMVVAEARAMWFDFYKDGITSEIDRHRRRTEVRSQRQRHIIENTDNDNRPNYGRK